MTATKSRARRERLANQAAIATAEAHKLQEAIEVLNRAGLEHHFGTFLLLQAKDQRQTRIEEIWDELSLEP